jgi:hypothetical protein
MAGTYALAGIGRGGQAQTAAVGVLTFDGKGNVFGSGTANVPGAVFGQRKRVATTYKGTYTVDDNGSGYGSTRLTSTTADGSSHQVDIIFLITKAELLNGAKVAQEVSMMQEAVDAATGSLMMYSAIRYPDEGKFSFASFRGTYGGPGIGRGNEVPAMAIGVGGVNFDGNGRFTAVDIQNLPVPGGLFHERRMVTFDTPHGGYTIDEDGTGTIIGQNGQAIMVVTRAKAVEGVRVCLEYFFVTNDLLPPTGNLVTTFVTKRLP